MRIAYLATSYPASLDDPSGHFVRAEALAAARRGDETHVLAPSPYAERSLISHSLGGTSLFRWPGAAATLRRDPLAVFAAPRFAAAALRVLRRLRPDRVVAHWLVPSAYPIALATRAEFEVVCHGADVRLLLALPRELRAHVVERVLARAAIVRFAAEKIRQDLSLSLSGSLEKRLERVTVVAPPLVDVTERASAPASSRRYMVVAGRMLASKRADVAIDAVCMANADVDLVVMGDGPELSRLRSRASPRVHFLGRVGRRTALGVMAGGRALLHPSEVDAAPTVILEARRLGVPVVASDVGDVARWAARDPGIAIVAREAGAYRREIERLV